MYSVFAKNENSKLFEEMQAVNDAIWRLENRLNDLADKKKQTVESSVQSFTLTQISSLQGESQLTTVYLAREVLPFIQSIISLQCIIDAVTGKSHKPIKIKRIQQNSPISVDLEGGA